MENSNGTSNLRNFPYGGRQTQFPPKSPFQHISPPSDDYIFSPAVGSKGIPKPTEVQKRHQRTPSESFLREEQPSWLDELLNEPETPLHRGHRRSSSDSFAYLDAAAKVSEKEEQKFKNITAEPSWGSQNFDHYRDLWHASLYQKPNSFDKKQIGAWESSLNSVTYSSGLPSCSHGISPQTSGFSCSTQEPDGVPSKSIEKQGRKESSSHNRDDSSEISDCSHAKPSVSRTDSNHSKQQFAQRSRVRKLQYIAELERNVQALQAEGSEVSAELEFLDRQNLILNMENRALKQRLDSLSQEQLIKHMEQDLFKKEIGRLQTLYQQQLQQQQRQQQHSAHRRSKSRDLDSQFSKLSIKHKEASSSGSESGGSLQI